MRYQDLIEDVLEFAVHLQALYAGLLARHRTQLQEEVATEEARLEHLHACGALAYLAYPAQGESRGGWYHTPKRACCSGHGECSVDPWGMVQHPIAVGTMMCGEGL